MTSGGGYKAFSRHGMLDSTSPFQQISFETAVDGLKNAVLQGNVLEAVFRLTIAIDFVRFFVVVV